MQRDWTSEMALVWKTRFTGFSPCCCGYNVDENANPSLLILSVRLPYDPLPINLQQRLFMAKKDSYDPSTRGSQEGLNPACKARREVEDVVPLHARNI